MPTIQNAASLSMRGVLDSDFSTTMRKMFVPFAKTENPSLPAEVSPYGKAKEWPAYDLEDKGVMVFDVFDIHVERESVRKLLDWDGMQPPTTRHWL